MRLRTEQRCHIIALVSSAPRAKADRLGVVDETLHDRQRLISVGGARENARAHRSLDLLAQHREITADARLGPPLPPAAKTMAFGDRALDFRRIREEHCGITLRFPDDDE